MLSNGQPAKLFSSYDQQTVNTHFQWMQQHGCDTAALQRFNPFGGEGPTRDAMAVKVRQAAEQYGRKFFIMYDATGWENMQSEMKSDWTAKMSVYTASPAYARQNGKPVVCIWGFGFDEANKASPASVCLDVVNWFKNQGCYVIGGVDQADCDVHGIDYQPCVIPGDLQSGHRRHGDLMWRQFYNLKRVGVQGLYISMFDEYNEGNQIAKTAESGSWVPQGSGIRALDEDGTACSSDYYLRLTNDGGRMFKGELPLTEIRPTPPMPDSGAGGVIFYEHVDYGGAAGQAIAKGNYSRAQLQAAGVQDNWASSVRIPAGWTVTIYAEDGFGGQSWTRTADTPNFVALSPNANDQLSSCRIE